jgi:hypothetical protein
MKHVQVGTGRWWPETTNLRRRVTLWSLPVEPVLAAPRPRYNTPFLPHVPRFDWNGRVAFSVLPVHPLNPIRCSGLTLSSA